MQRSAAAGNTVTLLLVPKVAKSSGFKPNNGGRLPCAPLVLRDVQVFIVQSRQLNRGTTCTKAEVGGSVAGGAYEVVQATQLTFLHSAVVPKVANSLG